ncbi:hypothetical protein [Streptomyces sp. NA02536]|uniref:hypothetical protein n=1 Tax=Streptomyces sp. NA02536 TaxID=2742133 RepID=UPI0015910368|nr:hypothetical protein [Streptomyces sp. NA02536]QKW03065.1 hypothetical protein HUT14_25930 [Streptomyces sp. NA02536]
MGRRSPLAHAPRPTLKGRQRVHFDGAVKAVCRTPIVLATGETGLRAHAYPQYLTAPRVRVVVTELRAVYWGLRRILAAHPGWPVKVRVDNLDDLDLLHEWQRGGYWMPDGYETRLRSQGRSPSLVKLKMYAEYTPDLTFVHEKAHVGDPRSACAPCAAGCRRTRYPGWYRSDAARPRKPCRFFSEGGRA